MAQQVTEPLESQLRAIKGVSRTIARSESESCSILLQYAPTASTHRIAFEATAIVNGMAPSLPDGVSAAVVPSDVGRPPDFVLALVLEAERTGGEQYNAAREFGTHLMQLPEPVKYELQGEPVEEIVVELDRARMTKFGLTTADLADALRREVLDVPEGPRVVLRPAESAAELAKVPLKAVGAATVRVEDVAHVTTKMTPGAFYHVNGEPVIPVHVFLRSGASPDEVRTCLRRILDLPRTPPIRKVLPLSIRGR